MPLHPIRSTFVRPLTLAFVVAIAVGGHPVLALAGPRAADANLEFEAGTRGWQTVLDGVMGGLSTGRIAAGEGYTLHRHKKLHIRRQHERQVVTGLVVNEKVNLPRHTRHWLRAVEHHARTGKPVTLTPAQREGWKSLRTMIQKQVKASAQPHQAVG